MGTPFSPVLSCPPGQLTFTSSGQIQEHKRGVGDQGLDRAEDGPGVTDLGVLLPLPLCSPPRVLSVLHLLLPLLLELF